MMIMRGTPNDDGVTMDARVILPMDGGVGSAVADDG